MGVLLTRVFVPHACLVSLKVRKRCQKAGNWSYRCLSETMKVPGIEPWFKED